MRVLIIEDEPRLARNIARVLDEEVSYAVDISNEGVEGHYLAITNPYDLLILDLMLPGMDGLRILRDLRQRGIMTPVLILTALDSRDDIVKGLNCGSDDYLAKPFDMKILLARCRALVRRSYSQPEPIIQVGDITINTNSHQVVCKGQIVKLSAMEYRLLEYLARRPGQVVSKTEIEEHLYDFGAEKFSNVVEVYISQLRKKLAEGTPQQLIKTLRSQGYVFWGEAQ